MQTLSLLLILILTLLLNLLKVLGVLKTDTPLRVTGCADALGRKWKLAPRWLLLFPHFSNISTSSHVAIDMYTNQDSVPVTSLYEAEARVWAPPSI